MSDKNNGKTIIHQPAELLSWLIKQMEAAEPTISISRELNQRCDLFLEELQSECLLTFAPVTKNTVRRDEELGGAMQDKCDRSATIMHFLRVIGTHLERQPVPVVYPLDDLIAYAIAAWPESSEFLIVAGPLRSANVVSRSKMLTDENILISVPLEAVGARLRFGKGYLAIMSY